MLTIWSSFPDITEHLVISRIKKSVSSACKSFSLNIPILWIQCFLRVSPIIEKSDSNRNVFKSIFEFDLLYCISLPQDDDKPSTIQASATASIFGWSLNMSSDVVNLFDK